jgi:hypothetical protein
VAPTPSAIDVAAATRRPGWRVSLDRVAHVANQVLDPAHATSVATPLFDGGHAAKRLHRVVAGGLGRHPRRDVRRRFFLEVRAQFARELVVDARRAKQRSEAQPQFVELAHEHVRPP